MAYKDYYQVLGIPRTASEDDVKQAYRKLARKYHPDVSKEMNAEQRFKDLNEAHDVLKDPKKRALYDQYGEAWKAAAEGRAPSPGAERAPEDFRAQGFDPEGYTLYTVAALEVFAEAAKQAGSTELDALLPVLHGTTFKTVIGDLAFDAKGDVLEPKYSIYRFQNGGYGEM